LRASVVIDNRNYARFLGAAIDSALAQSHPACEVVVVDDGSTDDSRDVIARYGDRVVPVLRPHGGQAAALNAGFAAARGDLVLFLDSDDVLEPDAVAAAVAEHERAPFAKVHWPLRRVDVEGRDLGTLDPPVALPEGDLTAVVVERGPGAYTTPPTSGNAYARAFLEQVMPVPEELRMAADGFLYGLAPLFGRIARLPRPLAHYRQHPASLFGARPLDERLAHAVAVHETLIPRLAARCRALGLPADEPAWRARSWPLAHRAALDELDAVVPPGVPFALADGGAQLVEAGAHRAPLPLPADGSAEATLAALDGLRTRGVRFLVVAWPAFDWWARAHRVVARVRGRDALVHESPRLLVFALGAPAPGLEGLRWPRAGKIWGVAGDGITLTREDEGALARVEVSGELDVASGEELRGVVGEVLDAGAERLVLDLADVEFLDSAGLAAVLDVARTAHGRGTEFSVSSPSGSEARLVIDLSGTASMLGLDRTRS